MNPLDLAELQEMRLRRASPRRDGRNAYEQLRHFVEERLSVVVKETNSTEKAALRPLLIERFNELLIQERIVLKNVERRQLIEDIFASLLPGEE